LADPAQKARSYIAVERRNLDAIGPS